jgi:hypothetical protein
MKIYEPGELKRIEDDEKRREKKRSRKIIRDKYTRDDRVFGVWEAVYKKGSMPEAKYSVQYYSPK